MAYQIELVHSALSELSGLRQTDRVKVMDRIRLHLSHQPTLQSKTRIKALRGTVFPPYRLRVDRYRVFYDVLEAEQKVVVYGIVDKAEAADWLARSAPPREEEDE